MPTSDHAVTRDRTEGERGLARLSRSRVSQAEPADLSVSPVRNSLDAGSRWHVRYTGSAQCEYTPVLLRASHENARRHEVTPRCLTRHEPALSAQSFILHHTGCLGVLTAPTAMRLVDPVVISLFSPMATSNIFTRWDSLGDARWSKLPIFFGNYY